MDARCGITTLNSVIFDPVIASSTIRNKLSVVSTIW